MIKRIITVVCLVVLSSGLSCAGSDIVIVRGQDFPPYHHLDPDHGESGLVVDIIRSVAGAMDMTVTFEQYPWSRCLEMVKNGRADAMMNLTKTEEREQFLWFSDNILVHEINRFFKLKDSGIDYSGDVHTLMPLRIGAVRNYSYGHEFDQVQFPNIFQCETENDLIRNLVKNRLDVIVGNEIVISRFIRQENLVDVITPMSPILSRVPLYIGFSKALDHEELAGRFSMTLGRYRKNGQYDDILEKYDLFSLKN